MSALIALIVAIVYPAWAGMVVSLYWDWQEYDGDFQDWLGA